MSSKMKRTIVNLVSQVKNAQPAVKASLAFLVMSIIEKGVTFITSPIYTRILSKSEYGQVAVFLSWLSLLGVITMFCLSAGVFNNAMLDYEDDRDDYSFSMLVLSNIITLLCLIPLAVFYPYINHMLDIDFPLLLLMFLMFFTQPAYNFWFARQRFEYKYKALSAVVITSSMLSPMAAITAILFFPESKVYARLFGGYGVFIFVYSALYLYTAVKARWKLNKSYWKEALFFNLPLIPHYLSGYVLNNSDRIMIATLVNASAAAMYSLAYTVGLAITIVWGAINGSLIPYTYEKCRKCDFMSLSAVTGSIIILYAVLCGALILLAPEFVMIMAPVSYYECIYIIPPIVGGIFFMALYFIFANVVYYYKRPKYVMFASVAAATLNIFLNWIFIPRYGYLAAGYTTLACYLLQAILDYYAMKKVVVKDIYDVKLLITLGITVLCVSIFSSFIYYHSFIRYFLIALFITTMFIFRKKFTATLLCIRNKNAI